jgi:hypothetical protein
LLSDPGLLHKPILIGLLGCEPGAKAGTARKVSHWRSQPCDWPAFSAGTQGDFACYLLSGIGRLARLLGHKGLVILLDEMERWQDLNWQAQSRAGNLLGGLIWGTTAREGKRGPADRPLSLWNSGRCGGTPFTTASRSHIGLAIAMTPRGDDGPELLWETYGPFQKVDLPAVGLEEIKECAGRVASWYASAYGLPTPDSDTIAGQALKAWRQQSDASFRAAVQVIVRVLEDWRDTLLPES